jgi:uncharacterized protein (TIGR02246 family)
MPPRSGAGRMVPTAQKGEMMQQSVEAANAIPVRMIEAWNRGDATGFFADFADDAEIVEFDGTVLRGRESMVAVQRPLFETVLDGSRLVRGEVLFSRIIGPGSGIVHHRFAVVMAGEEEPPPSRYCMQLIAVTWQNDRWEVVTLQNARIISMRAAAALETMSTDETPTRSS